MAEMNKELVWYITYGSNLSHERFNCYIAGGTPEGSEKKFEGCRDKNLPRDVKETMLHQELYFAENSASWQNGGVAFIKNEINTNITTLCVKYLITRQQLEDIAKQETSTKRLIELDFEKAIEEGFTIYRQAWYGKLLFLGIDDDIPQFTLTSEIDRENIQRPSNEYLRMIARGLQQQYDFSIADVSLYLFGMQGLGNLQAHEIYTIILNRDTTLEDAVRDMMNALIKNLSDAESPDAKAIVQANIDRFANAYYGRITFE